MGALGGTGGNPSFVATADVHVSRAVMASTIAGQTSPLPASPGIMGVVDCTTTGAPVGISQEGSYYTPGLAGSDVTIAAPAGYGVHVYGPGEVCWGTCDPAGLDIPAGAFVKVVTSAGLLGPVVGSAFQSGQWVVGRALEAIPAGKVGKIYVNPQQLAIPQS